MITHNVINYHLQRARQVAALSLQEVKPNLVVEHEVLLERMLLVAQHRKPTRDLQTDLGARGSSLHRLAYSRGHLGEDLAIQVLLGLPFIDHLIVEGCRRFVAC